MGIHAVLAPCRMDLRCCAALCCAVLAQARRRRDREMGVQSVQAFGMKVRCLPACHHSWGPTRPGQRACCDSKSGFSPVCWLPVNETFSGRVSHQHHASCLPLWPLWVHAFPFWPCAPLIIIIACVGHCLNHARAPSPTPRPCCCSHHHRCRRWRAGVRAAGGGRCRAARPWTPPACRAICRDPLVRHWRPPRWGDGGVMCGW